MIIESVLIKDFRNIKSETAGEALVKLNAGVNILNGRNAQGKTNFIEAVYFCATARSHRTASVRELICFDKDWARLQAVVLSENAGRDVIDAVLKPESKGIAVNGLPIGKLGDLFGLLYSVIFSPEDLVIIKAGPGERRRFMDMQLCQTSKVYYFELKQYYKILKQRNSLLKSLQRGKDPMLFDTLSLWDEQLSASGVKISEHRREYIEKINRVAGEIHKNLAGSGEILSAAYKPSVGIESYLDKLVKNRDKDILYGTTGAGIHKDDVLFTINGLDSRIYSSQGQQRTAALALKLAEVSLIHEEKNELPVLLLDDVLSELDKARREALLDAVTKLGLQTIITCAGMEDILRRTDFAGGAMFFNVEDGVLRPWGAAPNSARDVVP